MQSVSSVGKRVPGSSVGKLATGTIGGKTSNRCQTLDNMQLIPSVVKHAISVGCGNKMCLGQV